MFKLFNIAIITKKELENDEKDLFDKALVARENGDTEHFYGYAGGSAAFRCIIDTYWKKKDNKISNKKH